MVIGLWTVFPVLSEHLGLLTTLLHTPMLDPNSNAHLMPLLRHYRIKGAPTISEHVLPLPQAVNGGTYCQFHRHI